MNFSFLLNSRTIIDFLSDPWIIFSMIALIFGVALALLAKKITIVCKPQEENVTETKLFKMLLLSSLLLIAIGLVLLIVGTAFLTGLFA